MSLLNQLTPPESSMSSNNASGNAVSWTRSVKYLPAVLSTADGLWCKVRGSGWWDTPSYGKDNVESDRIRSKVGFVTAARDMLSGGVQACKGARDTHWIYLYLIMLTCVWQSFILRENGVRPACRNVVETCEKTFPGWVLLYVPPVLGELTIINSLSCIFGMLTKQYPNTQSLVNNKSCPISTAKGWSERLEQFGKKENGFAELKSLLWWTSSTHSD